MGRFGPFVQIGTKDDEEKPRFAGLRPGQKMDAITLEQALELFKLPRTLGSTAEGEPILANVGRFGPYIKYGSKYVSLKDDDPYTVTLERALECIRSSRRPTPIASSRTSASTISRCSTAATGPTSATAKRTRASPRIAIPRALTLEECRALLAAAPARPLRGRGRFAPGSRSLPLQPPAARPLRRQLLAAAAPRQRRKKRACGQSDGRSASGGRRRARPLAPAAQAQDRRPAPQAGLDKRNQRRKPPPPIERQERRQSARRDVASSRAAAGGPRKPRVPRSGPADLGAMKYRHSFHAGNFADVHKHVALLALLQAMQRKDKGFLYLDTHAGAGRYDLAGADTHHGAEARHGITALLSAAARAAGRGTQSLLQRGRRHCARAFGRSAALSGLALARRAICCVRRIAASAGSCCRPNAARWSARSAAFGACASNAPTATEQLRARAAAARATLPAADRSALREPGRRTRPGYRGDAKAACSAWPMP